MANLFTVRGLLPHFTNRELRHGPSVFNLTDLHGSDIFIDSDGHIKYNVDLEWACWLPIEMLAPPYWITSRGADELVGDELRIFEEAYQDFTDTFEEEEKNLLPVYGSKTYRADLMRRGWKNGSFWYFHALNSPGGLFNLFRQHVQPIFEPRANGSELNIDGFTEAVSPYWASDMREVIEPKLVDMREYEQELRELFEKGGPVTDEL